LVSKAHAVAAWFFAIVFLFASFGLSLPILGPAALLQGWDLDNVSLVYMTRITSGFLTAIGLYEWNMPEAKRPFVYYHVILAILTLYSSVAAAVGVLGWLYAVLVTLFLISGILGTTDTDAVPMERLDDSSKTPVVMQCHAIVAGLFGLVFLLASFGFDIPLIGPAALLHGWHMRNAALVYLVRFISGLLFGVCMYEWVYNKAVKVQPSFNIYHAITAALALYSSIAAAKGVIGWLYAVLISVFLIAGLVAEQM
jgi:hypothetical protein